MLPFVWPCEEFEEQTEENTSVSSGPSKFSNGTTTAVNSVPDCDAESQHSTPSSMEQEPIVPIVDCLLSVEEAEQFSS